MRIQAAPNGILYHIRHFFKPLTVPIKPSDIRLRPDLCDTLYELEQQWLQGHLEVLPSGDMLLEYNALLTADNETCERLKLVPAAIELSLTEKSFFGSESYHILWSPLINGRKMDRYQRHQTVIASDNAIYVLTKAQYELIEYIERSAGTRRVDQARYQTHARRLAESAHAFMCKNLLESENLYVESVGFSFETPDDHTISISPLLSEIPSEYQVEKAKRLLGSQQKDINGKRVRIVCEDSTAELYNKTAATIKDADVPAFLDNPLAFLPELVVFDPEIFSARVKGLKIARYSAVPYVHLEPSDQKRDWFSLNAGVYLKNEDGEHTLLDENDINQLYEKVKDSPSPYVYHNGQWIYIDGDNLKKFDEAAQKLNDLLEDEGVHRSNVRQILDICQNVDLLEYNETIIEQRELLYDMKNQEFVAPKLLAAKLRPHQQQAYIWFLTLEQMHTGSLLADDMGLGKTVEVIAYIAHIMENQPMARFLLVMPSALTDNWVNELCKFIIGMTPQQIYVHQGSHRYKTPEALSVPTIVITTYETLARDQVLFGQIHWDMIVCDETQKIKNFKTQLANAVKGMKADRRIAMTGTPVENRLSELWSIVDFVQPGLLNNYQWFRKTYEIPIQKESAEESPATQELVQTIRPVFLRRTKEEVLSDLPDKQEIVRTCGLTNEQLKMYFEIVKQVREDQSLPVLAGLTQLIELCSHPSLLLKQTKQPDVKKTVAESGKLQETIQILKEICERKEKVLIFTRYRQMQQLLQMVVYEYFKIWPLIINGEISESRTSIIDRFSEIDGFNVLILSPRAAGVGLTITAANNVIHYTREWNPAIENQATDRVHRIGQKNNVNVYLPICKINGKETVEEKIHQLLADKRRLMRSVIIPANLEITADDLHDVFE